jgi:hypothetical protein
MTSDGRWFVVASSGSLKLYDMRQPDWGAAPVTIREYGDGFVKYAVSSDSRWLVSLDSPYDIPPESGPPMTAPSVRIFDLWASDVPASMVELPPVPKPPLYVDISWDSQWLATIGNGVALWPLGVSALAAIAERTAGREFTAEERKRYLIE